MLAKLGFPGSILCGIVELMVVILLLVKNMEFTEVDVSFGFFI